MDHGEGEAAPERGLWRRVVERLAYRLIEAIPFHRPLPRPADEPDELERSRSAEVPGELDDGRDEQRHGRDERSRDEPGDLAADLAVEQPGQPGLAAEAALLADRSDISEELIRLKTHVAELEQLLNAGGENGAGGSRTALGQGPEQQAAAHFTGSVFDGG